MPDRPKDLFMLCMASTRYEVVQCSSACMNILPRTIFGNFTGQQDLMASC